MAKIFLNPRFQQRWLMGLATTGTIIALGFGWIVFCNPAFGRSDTMQFTGKDAELERAIIADDPAAVTAAVEAGAEPNARGLHGVTPLEFAIGTGQKNAAAELIRHHADPNIKDVEGDNAVTRAVNTYKSDPELLAMVLDAGGDPNTSRPDGDPVITRFVNDHNLDAITYLHSQGASIDAEINKQPMVVNAAIASDWDVVWRLIELGAQLDTPKVREGLLYAFKSPELTPPDSPLYPDMIKVWSYLKEMGVTAVPPVGVQQ